MTRQCPENALAVRGGKAGLSWVGLLTTLFLTQGSCGNLPCGTSQPDALLKGRIRL